MNVAVKRPDEMNAVPRVIGSSRKSPEAGRRRRRLARLVEGRRGPRPATQMCPLWHARTISQLLLHGNLQRFAKCGSMRTVKGMRGTNV